MLRPVVLALTLVACGNDPSCKEYAKDLGTLLEAAAEEPPALIQIPDDMTVAEAHDMPATRLSVAPTVFVTKTTAKYQDHAYATEELGALLADAHAKIADDLASGRARPAWIPDPDLAYFVIDVAAPWPLVVASIEQASRAGFAHIGLVYAKKSTLTPPPRAPVDKRLDEILHAEDAGNKATELAKLVSDQVSSCPQLQKEFGSVASDDGDNRAMMMAKAVPPALVACECRVPMANFRSAMFRLMYVEKPIRVRQVTVGSGDKLELPATALWADAVGLLRQTTKAVQLAVAGANGSAGSAAP
jgi:hypothetical protein